MRKTSCKGKCQEKIRAKKKVKKKIHAEGGSNFDFYLIYKNLPVSIKNNYCSKYSSDLNPGPVTLLLIDKSI